jgi:hypothetical protein
LPARTIPTKFDLVINLKAGSASPCRARPHRRTCGSPQARSSPTDRSSNLAAWNYHLDMVGTRAGGIPPGGQF